MRGASAAGRAGGAAFGGAPRVLVVDDNTVFARALARCLEARSLEVRWLTHGAQVPGELERSRFAAAVIEAVMPGLAGVRLLEHLRTHAPELRVVVVAASANLQTAVEAMKRGAVDYVVKPVSPEAIADLVRDLVPDLPSAVPAEEGGEAAASEIIGGCPAMREVLALVDRVAATDAPVLITGESGTGKELVARAIHRRSRRGGSLFLAVNCGALAEGVLDSELFGHVRGAFTDARADRRGLFAEADRGSIFLDEIASTPLAFQVKLLRVLEDGEVRPVGSSSSLRTDVRILAAANIDLREAVRAGRFREDLYYRLNVVAIELPPLRERGEDLDLLVRHFVARSARELGKRRPAVDPAFVALLRAHRWPGNVRELRNAIERAVLLAAGERLGAADVASELGAEETGAGALPRRYADAKRQALLRFTREYLDGLLPRFGGNVTRAAAAAGIPRQTLHRLLRSLRPRSDRA